MAVLVSERNEPAIGNIDESLDHEREAQVETRQLLADLKDKNAIVLEMIAILRGLRGPAARRDRKAAWKALAKVKQRRALAEQSLRRTQNRLKSLEEQSSDVNHAVIKKARKLFPYASPNASISAEASITPTESFLTHPLPSRTLFSS
jgi:septal ring factor EnvC (AmiA/AmiB activator)